MIILGAMALGAAGALAWPLLRRRAPAPGRASFDRAVIADQLAEITRDGERGLIGAAEAAAARAEIERRALMALEADQRGDAPGRHPVGRALAAALIVALPAAAGLAYVMLGAPGLPARPFAARPQAPAPPAMPSPEAFAAMVAMIEARLKEAPDDAQGWMLLLRLYQRLGRTDDAEGAYRRAIDAADKDPARAAAIALAYGEALLGRADGTVTPAAKAAFDAALTAAPANPAARYYRGLWLAQSGDPAGALAIWRKVEKDSPADAPWRAMLRGNIERLARETGLDPGTAP